MTNQKMIITLTIMGLAAIAILAYFATMGNLWAYALLFAAWSIGCVVLGWALSYNQIRTMTTREQENFINNAKENMALVGTIQSVQNQQNSTIMRQLSQAAKLPDGGHNLLIDDVIFDELED